MSARRLTASTLLWDALLGGLSGALGVGGIVIGVIAWVEKPDTKVSLAVVVLVFSVLLWLLVGLAAALRRSASMLGYSSMEVVKITKPRAPHTQCRCIFQLKPPVRLPIGINIAFHWVDVDGFERDLGVGTVQRDLENLNIEATLDFIYDDPDAGSFLEKLLQNDINAIGQLRVVDRIPLQFRAHLVSVSKGEALRGPRHAAGGTKQLGPAVDQMSADES